MTLNLIFCQLISGQVNVEKGYLMPYTGKAMMPERAMQEYMVYKTNIIGYKGNSYSLPNGSYQGPGTKVWVNEKEERLEIYSKDTGKLLVTHLLSKNKGEYILDPSHRKVHFIQADKLESKILEYSGYDNLAPIWMLNLKKEKPRYYNQNLRMLASNMEHFEVATLHLVFSKCIDAGMYNAKEFLMLCDRVGKRKVVINSTKSPNITAKVETPDKTPISSYNQYFS